MIVESVVETLGSTGVALVEEDGFGTQEEHKGTCKENKEEEDDTDTVQSQETLVTLLALATLQRAIQPSNSQQQKHNTADIRKY